MNVYVSAFAILLMLLSGCAPASNPPIEWIDDSVNLRWPNPPAKTRIRYLRTLTGSADFSTDRVESRLFSWLSGENTERYSFSSPYAVTADGNGRVWGTDLSQSAIFAFDMRSRKLDVITSLSGRRIQTPVGIVYDSRNNRLYLSDATQRKVYVLTPEGRFLGTREPVDGFLRPAGLAVDSVGNLYVADVPNHRVVVFSENGEQLRVVTSQQPPEMSFGLPAHLFVDKNDNLYVTDSLNFRVEIFNADGVSQGTVGRLGDVAGHFARPRGVAVDQDSNIYVVDATFGNIQVFDKNGSLLTYFGRPGRAEGKFSLPAGMFCDDQNRIYVVDVYNKRIQIFEYFPE